MPAPHYQTFDKLRRIWSPEDFRKLQEHAAKFDSLPAMPVVTSAMMPAHDGDTAELAELADRVLDGLDAAFSSGESFSFRFESAFELDPLYQQMTLWFGHALLAPRDRAADLLAQWPARIMEVAS